MLFQSLQICLPFFIGVTGFAAYSPKKNESEERTATNSHTFLSSCISFLLPWMNPVLSAEQTCHLFPFCIIKISFSIWTTPMLYPILPKNLFWHLTFLYSYSLHFSLSFHRKNLYNSTLCNSDYLQRIPSLNPLQSRSCSNESLLIKTTNNFYISKCNDRYSVYICWVNE